MGYLTWILGLLGAIMLGLVKDEISAWMPSLARWCVHRAADRMPDRERWREEWLAHLDECPGKLGQLLHAFGVFGIGQRHSLRFWIEILRYLPGIRWSFIDLSTSIIGTILSVFTLYAWLVSSEFVPILLGILFVLLGFSFFAGKRASKRLPLDKEMLRLARAYRKAHGLD